MYTHHSKRTGDYGEICDLRYHPQVKSYSVLPDANHPFSDSNAGGK
jgi:hypothetical protein